MKLILTASLDNNRRDNSWPLIKIVVFKKEKQFSYREVIWKAIKK